MSSKEFRIGIDYHQIAVFDPKLPNPFNRWTDIHVQQGFAWRPGSVSFATLSQSGNVKIVVLLSPNMALPPGVIRATIVPFAVHNNEVEVGGVFDSVKVGLPSGSYELLCATVPKGEDPGREETYFFQFMRSPNPLTRIVLSDAELTPPSELCMSAEPA